MSIQPARVRRSLSRQNLTSVQIGKGVARFPLKDWLQHHHVHIAYRMSDEEDNDVPRHLIKVEIATTAGRLKFQMYVSHNTRTSSAALEEAAIQKMKKILRNPNSAIFTFTHLGSSVLRDGVRE